MGHLCVDARGLCKSSLTFNMSQAVLSSPLPQVSPSLHTRQWHYPSPSPIQTPGGEGGHPWSRPLPTTPAPSNPLAGPVSFTWKKYLQEHVVCTYDGKLFSQEKKGENPDICNDRNGPGGHCTKRNKPDTGRQILYNFIYTKESKVLKVMGLESRMVVTGVEGERGWGGVTQRYQVPVMQDEQVYRCKHIMGYIVNSTAHILKKFLRD